MTLRTLHELFDAIKEGGMAALAGAVAAFLLALNLAVGAATPTGCERYAWNVGLNSMTFACRSAALTRPLPDDPNVQLWIFPTPGSNQVQLEVVYVLAVLGALGGRLIAGKKDGRSIEA